MTSDIELKKDISKHNKVKYSLSGDEPSPDMFFATDGSALAFGWYDVKNSDKSIFAIQNRPIRVYTHSQDLDKDLKTKNTKNLDIYYPELKFKSFYGRIEGRVGKVKTSKGERYMISFWQNYDAVKQILDKTVEYVSKYLPIDKDNLIVSTRDKVGYYGKLEDVKPQEDRTKKLDLLMQYHKEVDPVKKKRIATELGLTTSTPKKIKTAVIGDGYRIDSFKKLIYLAEGIEYDYNDEEICFEGQVYAINAKFYFDTERNEVVSAGGGYRYEYFGVPVAFKEFEAFKIKNWTCIDDAGRGVRQMNDIMNQEFFPLTPESYIPVTDKNLEERLKEYVLSIAELDENIVRRIDPPEFEDYDD